MLLTLQPARLLPVPEVLVKSDLSANPFLDYFRCPAQCAEFGRVGELSADRGYFSFRGSVGYGQRRGIGARQVTDALPDVSNDVDNFQGRPRLPFDLSEVVTNLREERYYRETQGAISGVANASMSRGLYYLLRPLLPVAIRKHLQRIRLNGWDTIAFPRWPVDLSVDTLMRNAMGLALESRQVSSIPFIWFWPDATASALIITHDVEAPPGQAFCETLMDLNDSFGFKSSFQFVPEKRYPISPKLLACTRSRGFEVNVHDLYHDGYLFQSRTEFELRAPIINRYAREFQSRGFRAGAMYRQQEWLEALDFSYDMSVPNVAHLEPQRGGCCTVMPYFIGKMVELPLTTTQDYSLFHIIGAYSIALWKQQIDLLMAHNGLITVLTHPDYLIDSRARAVYIDLLGYLRQLRGDGRLWAALPGDVERWWRKRNAMTLVEDGNAWRIEGDGSERARVAFASLENNRVVYRVSADPCAAEVAGI